MESQRTGMASGAMTPASRCLWSPPLSILPPRSMLGLRPRPAASRPEPVDACAPPRRPRLVALAGPARNMLAEPHRATTALTAETIVARFKIPLPRPLSRSLSPSLVFSVPSPDSDLSFSPSERVDGNLSPLLRLDAWCKISTSLLGSAPLSSPPSPLPHPTSTDARLPRQHSTPEIREEMKTRGQERWTRAMVSDP